MNRKIITSAGMGATLLMAGLSGGALAAGKNASIEGIVVGTYQAASESRVGGVEVDDEANAQLYLYGTLDMGPGAWNMEVRAGTTPATNGVTSFYGSNGLIGETTDDDGDGRIAVTQLFYELPVGPGQLRAGLLDPAAVLDANDIANDEYTQFLADAFVNNSTIGFPSFVLGAAYQGNITENVGFNLFVSSDSGLEEADHSYDNVFSIGGERGGYEKGAFTAAELGWHADGYSLKGGVWYDTGNVAELDGTGDTNGYGLYLLAGMPVGSGLLQARAGIANGDAQAAANFLSVAYQLPVKLGDRETTLGLAIARTGPSDELAGADAIYQAEAYWRINVAGPVYVSPDIQYIQNAGFDGDADGVFIGGVRVGVAF